MTTMAARRMMIPVLQSMGFHNWCQCRRALSLSARRLEHGEHNEDQKTTVTLLNRESPDLICLEGISELGFVLSTGLTVLGSVAVFPRSLLGWSAASAADITPAALSLFSVLEPRLDCLVIGTGAPGTTVSKEVIAFLRRRRLPFEVLPTEQAVATFNFMNLERRCVAGALVPPARTHVRDHRDRERQAQLDRRRLIDAE